MRGRYGFALGLHVREPPPEYKPEQNRGRVGSNPDIRLAESPRFANVSRRLHRHFWRFRRNAGFPKQCGGNPDLPFIYFFIIKVRRI